MLVEYVKCGIDTSIGVLVQELTRALRASLGSTLPMIEEIEMGLQGDV